MSRCICTTLHTLGYTALDVIPADLERGTALFSRLTSVVSTSFVGPGRCGSPSVTG
jgi:hypothetical protein